MAKKIIPWKLVISGLKNDIHPDDKALLEQWLASPDNRKLYEEFENLWETIKQETSEYHPDVDLYWKKLQSHINKDKRFRKFHIGVKTIASVAAAIVLVVISASYLIVSSYTKEHSNMQTYTSFNGKSKVILPDESVVWLNTGSTIRYSSLFARNRNLELDGEALFDVTKDTKSPFIVHTSGIQIKVYGTRFNVNSYPKDDDVKVTLLEGSVSIIADEKETHMKPGEIASFNKSAHTFAMLQSSQEENLLANDRLKSSDVSGISPEMDNLKFESFWANEMISFEHKDLGYICKYLEKWYKVEIILDPALSDSQYYTFTLRDEPLELILRIMNKINPMEYSFTNENIVYITNVKSLKNK